MDEQLRQFMRQGLGIREVLQIVEDELLAKGYDDLMVATERGSFHWMTVERAREQYPLSCHAALLTFMN